MNTLDYIKNTYAQEQGYDNWKAFLNYYGGRHPEWFEQHWTEICIRAQKAALENAAENGLVRLNFNNLNDNSGISEKRFIIKDTPGFYEIDPDSITNPKNLIK